MSSKVSFVNFNYLKENMKKSRGVILLFVLIIPVFTYLFILVLNSAHSNMPYFPTLADISIPALIGIYIIPFIVSVTLFNFLFKKDSVDFITALPLKRQTIYITNIIGGILIFLVMFAITSILMILTNSFFSDLVIPKMMYFHFFITFFITYIFTFIVSTLTLSLTGSRVAHVALTLIILFIPGFISDFYNGRVYDDKVGNYQYPTCNRYDSECVETQIYNEFVVSKSYKLENGQTLPYKYISTVPRALFGHSYNEISYQNELSSVYDISSIIRMIILSIIYFIIGLYAFNNRKMEIAETTFRSENIHQLVKCFTLFPLCFATITIFAQESSMVVLWVMIAITITIYIVYDLITRRNSGQFIKSVIYFLGLVLSTMIIYISLDQISNLESSKVISKDDVASLGIAPNAYFGDSYNNADMSIIDFKLKNHDIIDLIFNNVNKKMTGTEASNRLAICLNLKSGSSYYFNIVLATGEYDRLLKILDQNKGYIESFKNIPYDKVYGVKLGNSYLNKEQSDKVITLIQEGFKDKSVIDIVKQTYLDYRNTGDEYFNGYSLKYLVMNKLYVYDGGLKTYNVNSLINPKLKNYVMQNSNAEYINDIKNNNINVNQLNISYDMYNETIKSENYYQYINNDSNREELYRYINDNIKSDIDFSKYSEQDIILFGVWWQSKSFQIFFPKDAAFEELINKINKYAEENPITPMPIEGKY